MRKPLNFAVWFLCCLGLLVAMVATLRVNAAQYSDGSSGSSSNKQAQQPSTEPSDDQGPNRGVGETVIIPRKGSQPSPPPDEEAPPQPKEQPRQKASPANPDDTIHINTDVTLISVPVVVQDEKGNFIPSLGKENFRLFEDGAPQTIQKAEVTEAPVTIALVIEFSSVYWQFLYQTMEASYGFVNSLRPEDWVAVVAYDMKTEVLQDFTRNKNAAYGALNMMRIPGFAESNMFDAVSEILQRMQDIDGKKALVLISSGVDTFSKMRYDHLLKQVQASDTPLYAIGTGQAVREMYDARGMMGGSQEVAFLQADNQLRSFAKLSGGRAYFPRFEGQFPEIYNDISAALRNQYTLYYTSTNSARDGKYRKLRVDVVDKGTGKTLKLNDSKGKDIKYEVRFRDGYNAPRPVD